MLSSPPPLTIASPSRLSTLDLIRGIAVLGILPVNIEFFAGTVFQNKDLPVSHTFVDVLVLLIFEGKMVTLLSLLFGVGLALQADQAKLEGRRFAPYYLGRMTVLYIFGLLNVFLLFPFDILTSYAVVGVFALLFLRCTQRTLRRWFIGFFSWCCFITLTLAVLSLIIPSFTEDIEEKKTESAKIAATEVAAASPTTSSPPSISSSSSSAPTTNTNAATSSDSNTKTKTASTADKKQQSPAARKTAEERRVETVERFTERYFGEDAEKRIVLQGTWQDIIIYRGLYFLALIIFFWLQAGWYMFGCVLLGIWLARQRFFHDSEARQTLMRKMWLTCLVLAVIFHVGVAADYLYSPEDFFHYLILVLGALPLALVYLMSITHWSDKPSGPAAAWLKARLRTVGRMSMTNYLLGSFLCCLVFYKQPLGFGLGLYGSLGRPAILSVALAIWIFLILFSHLWLERLGFHQGPSEWLLAKLTKRRRQQNQSQPPPPPPQLIT